jgi:hypothetical protein
MEDITPLNLEDSPKLFGLRYDQLIAILISIIVSSQFYSWCNPIYLGGADLRLYISVFLAMIGPFYSLLTLNDSSTGIGNVVNFLFTCQVLIPGPDPNPTRFLIDEKLADFSE